MRASEIMHTPAVVCRADAPLREVAKLMEERRVGSVIVADRSDHVCGIVTDRDIALRAIGAGRSADIQVSTIMTRDVVCVPPTSELAEAASVMERRAVRRVPVVDELGRPHGMVSLDDLLRHLTDEADTLKAAVAAQARPRT